MIFSRIVYCAILVGVVSGLVFSGLQVASLDPIIFASETYEVAEAEPAAKASDHSHDHGHAHAHEGWSPQDGAERTAYTFVANVLAAIGFAAVLLALMCQFWLGRGRNIPLWQGLLWGFAGYLAVFIAPAIGMPPEIPGVVAAAVEHRQLWWVMTVLSVSIGLGLFAFAAPKLKPLGILFLAAPYLVGAPHLQGPLFDHPDPLAVEALTALHREFVINSAIVNLLYWLLMGVACRFAFNRWFSNIAFSDEYVRT